MKLHITECKVTAIKINCQATTAAAKWAASGVSLVSTVEWETEVAATKIGIDVLVTAATSLAWLNMMGKII